MSYQSALIAVPTLSDIATITAGSQVASMPAANLQTFQPSDVWLAPDLTATDLTIDLGVAANFNLIWIGFTNATSSATLRVRMSNNPATLLSAPAFDTGTMSHWPVADLNGAAWSDGFFWFGDDFDAVAGRIPTTSPVTTAYRYIHLLPNDPTNPMGFYRSGRLYIADAWRPVFDIQVGWKMGPVQQNIELTSQGNQLFIIPGALLWELKFTIGFMEEVEAFTRSKRIDRERGSHRDILVMRNPGDPLNPSTAPLCLEQSLYGVMRDLSGIEHQGPDVFNKSYSVLGMV